jgi:glycosyltransferase involved in cell wall biosynthesis
VIVVPVQHNHASVARPVPSPIQSRDRQLRIAYIAPYQGTALAERRPIRRNLSLAGNLKIESIGKLLRGKQHNLEILSQGEVIERRLTFYSAFDEPVRFHPEIPIHYASTLPVRFLNGLWSTWRSLALFKAHHRARPYDLVIIYNLKFPQVVCANYAIRRLRLPVILEYEDDAFVDVEGRAESGLQSHLYSRLARELLTSASACIGASPHLLAQVPAFTPKLLLRGIVGEDCIASPQQSQARKNRVLFSGTHFRSKGIEQLIKAWLIAALPDWELHITGYGELTDKLRTMAAGIPGIVFHGLVARPELVRLMQSARICINPHDVSHTPGNVFAFKLIEYLAAGAHVVTTPMGTLEPEIEMGITYMPDNDPKTIASTLADVVKTQRWHRTANDYVCDVFGPETVSASLETVIGQAVSHQPLRA